uniref:Uncharacterized protein n=1 Tax=Pristionchus pacificus TaxID=54126 RepID=A0A2A6BNK5_PRIPA|eukprot:PDM67341.1 hypothetical protein PRIPAC_48758 [Pristionchus pacificus]
MVSTDNKAGWTGCHNTDCAVDPPAATSDAAAAAAAWVVPLAPSAAAACAASGASAGCGVRGAAGAACAATDGAACAAAGASAAWVVRPGPPDAAAWAVPRTAPGGTRAGRFCKEMRFKTTSQFCSWSAFHARFGVALRCSTECRTLSCWAMSSAVELRCCCCCCTGIGCRGGCEEPGGKGSEGSEGSGGVGVGARIDEAEGEGGSGGTGAGAGGREAGRWGAGAGGWPAAARNSANSFSCWPIVCRNFLQIDQSLVTSSPCPVTGNVLFHVVNPVVV